MITGPEPGDEGALTPGAHWRRGLVALEIEDSVRNREPREQRGPGAAA
jgi:hypothetical protein